MDEQPPSKELSLCDVLRGGRQCDEDGVEIIMSRQACLQAADEIGRLQRECDQWKRRADELFEGQAGEDLRVWALARLSHEPRAESRIEAAARAFVKAIDTDEQIAAVSKQALAESVDLARAVIETRPPLPHVRAIPDAWIRGVVSHHGPSEPPDYDEEVVPGEDQPEGKGWVPLYRHAQPPSEIPSREGFQEWAKTQGYYNFRLSDDPFRTYHHEITEHAWRGWANSRPIRSPRPAQSPRVAAIPNAGPLATDLLDRVHSATSLDDTSIRIPVSRARWIIEALSAAENLTAPPPPAGRFTKTFDDEANGWIIRDGERWLAVCVDESEADKYIAARASQPPAPERQPIPVTEIVTALEREAANTDTDPRWMAAQCLRHIVGWESRTFMCRIDTRPSAYSTATKGADDAG